MARTLIINATIVRVHKRVHVAGDRATHALDAVSLKVALGVHSVANKAKHDIPLHLGRKGGKYP